MTRAPLRLVRIQPDRGPRSVESVAALAGLVGGRIGVLESARDGNVVFVRALHAATNVVRQSDGSRLHAIHVAAAGRYLAALDGWTRGQFGMTPEPWRALFAAVRQRALSPACVLEAATAIHLTYDWPLAIARSPHGDDAIALCRELRLALAPYAASIARGALLSAAPGTAAYALGPLHRRRIERHFAALCDEAAANARRLVLAGSDVEREFLRVESRVMRELRRILA
jgi:hypothetical protein